MRCVGRPLPGMLVLETEPRCDQRGFFARCFCRHELRDLGAEPMVEQANLSFSERRGTLRGLHYQLGPSAETKIVTCLQGAMHDVVLDLRPSSPTFGRWAAVELQRRERAPRRRARGLRPRLPHARRRQPAFYLVSVAYDPVRERAVRWDDPAFAIAWPFRPAVISDRDAAHPDFDPGFHLAA